MFLSFDVNVHSKFITFLHSLHKITHETLTCTQTARGPFPAKGLPWICHFSSLWHFSSCLGCVGPHWRCFLRWVVYHHLRQVSWKWRSASFLHQKRRIPIHQFPYSVTSALIITTSGGMSPFTRDALIITTQDPPGHAQTCSLDDPWWWHLVATETCTVGKRSVLIHSKNVFFSKHFFYLKSKLNVLNLYCILRNSRPECSSCQLAKQSYVWSRSI